MEERDTQVARPVVLCALVSGGTAGRVRVWGWWSRLRWYLLG